MIAIGKWRAGSTNTEVAEGDLWWGIYSPGDSLLCSPGILTANGFSRVDESVQPVAAALGMSIIGKGPTLDYRKKYTME